MVISDEIKFPRPIRVDPFRQDKKVAAVDGVMPIARIGAFKRAWNRRRGERFDKKPTFLPPDEREAVRMLVERVNTTLEDQHILLHLVLAETEDGGYSLDVYDCTTEDRCTVIKDIVIDLDDLPVLLRNLQDEAGLLVDTIS